MRKTNSYWNAPIQEATFLYHQVEPKYSPTSEIKKFEVNGYENVQDGLKIQFVRTSCSPSKEACNKLAV